MTPSAGQDQLVTERHRLLVERGEMATRERLSHANASQCAIARRMVTKRTTFFLGIKRRLPFALGRSPT